MAELPDVLEKAVFMLTMMTLIYGLTSWCLIKNFRKYRNFVLLNAIFANFLASAAMATTAYVNTIYKPTLLNLVINLFVTVYLSTVKHHWLIIISHMFYVDIVQVFNSHVSKRLLKSALFGWLAPLVISLMYMIATYFTLHSLQFDYIGFAMFMLPLLFSCILYIIIVISLCRSFNASGRPDQWRRLYIATLIFILSDIFLIYKYVLEFIGVINSTHSDLCYYVVICLHYLNPIVINIYLVIVKSNRNIWYEFYFNRLTKYSLASLRDQDSVSHESCIRESADSQPTDRKQASCLLHV